jgi:hypothetical protein
MGAAAHGGLDAVSNSPVGQQGEPLEAERRTRAIAEQALATFGVTGRHSDRRVDIETPAGLAARPAEWRETCLVDCGSRGGLLTRQLGELAEPQRPLQARIERRALRRVAVIALCGTQQAPALEPAQRAQLDYVGDVVEVAAIGKRQLEELRRAVRLTDEDAVRHRDVVVNVEVEATAEALGKADSAASKPSRARASGQPCARLLVLPAQDGLNEDAPDRAQGSSVLRQE